MKILFTIAYLDGFHGSVVHVKEWGEYLTSLGHEVTVFSIFWIPEILEAYHKVNLKILSVIEDDPGQDWDIVFAYHFPCLGTLLKRGLNCKKLILGSLSSFEYLESFPLYYHFASLLIVMSEETKNKHHQSYNIPLDKIQIIENCIPDKYLQFPKVNGGGQLSTIAVVSNHIPKEVEDIKTYTNSISVDFIGAGREIYQEISPNLLAKYDVIISIGKTVQYALGMGIPVYEYDHFGGIGYISPDNFEQEKKTNFSGRSSRRKIPTTQILEELISGYESALSNAILLKEKSKESFSLSTKLDNLLKALSNQQDFDRESLLSSYDKWALCFDHNECFCRWTFALKYQYFNLISSNSELIKKSLQLESLLTTRNNEIISYREMIQEYQRRESNRDKRIHRRIKRWFKGLRSRLSKLS